MRIASKLMILLLLVAVLAPGAAAQDQGATPANTQVQSNDSMDTSGVPGREGTGADTGLGGGAMAAGETSGGDGYGDEIAMAVGGLLILGLIVWMFSRRPHATTT